VSTFLASGAAAGDEGSADLLLSDPLHAAHAAASAAHTTSFRTCTITFHGYHEPEASRSLRRIRS
jgi:hypothetical protein